MAKAADTSTIKPVRKNLSSISKLSGRERIEILARSMQLAAIVRVGDGRGFIVKKKDGNKIVVTAGHCLPAMPPCMNFSDLSEKTYRGLVGPIGAKMPALTVECLFVDPISDLALLGPPDDQEFSNDFDGYQSFVEPLPPFSISAIPPTKMHPMMQRGEDGWVLSLAREWHPCQMSHFGGPLWLADGVKIEGGMSGSPILSARGDAIGVITSNAGQARLAHSLPAWVFD